LNVFFVVYLNKFTLGERFVNNTANNNTKENQHYVPQFYLKKFSDNDKCVPGYELNSKKYIPDISINKTAKESYYYGIDGTIENWFMELEGAWATIIGNIIDTKELPDLPVKVDDYFMLLLFLVLSDVRTLKMGKTVNEIRKKSFEHVSQFTEIDNEYFSRLDFNKHPNLFMFATMEDNFNDLAKLHPLLLLNDTNCDFCTSDNPCIKYNQFFASKELGYYGLKHGGIQIFIPLSPKICLCLYDDFAYDVPTKDNKERVEIKNPEQIIELNKLIVRNANRMIYFRNETNINCIHDIVSAHKRTDFKHFISSKIPVFGIQMESINDHYKLDLFSVLKSFEK